MKSIFTILLMSAAVMMLAQSSVEAQARPSQASAHSQNKCRKRCAHKYKKHSKQAYKEYEDCIKKAGSDPKQKDTCEAQYAAQLTRIDTDAEDCTYECDYASLCSTQRI